MPRTNDEMNQIAASIGEKLNPAIDAHPNLGAVLVVYELDGAEGQLEDSPLAFTATRYEHVRPVLAQVLELTKKIPVLRGERN